MLRSLDSLLGHSLQAKDGEIGKIIDLYFDSEDWICRYLVVRTGNWLTGNRVLVARYKLGEPEWEEESIGVDATRQEIEGAPRVESKKPVSAQEREKYAATVGWGQYWDPTTIGGGPPAIALRPKPDMDLGETAEDLDPHLRSYKEVTGYKIQAREDNIGHVEDFVLNTDDWSIRYMIVDTRNWLPGKKVLVAPDWIDRVVWRHSEVQVDLPKSLIKNSPEFDPSAPVNRDYEDKLYDYYGRQKYWEDIEKVK